MTINMVRAKACRRNNADRIQSFQQFLKTNISVIDMGLRRQVFT